MVVKLSPHVYLSDIKGPPTRTQAVTDSAVSCHTLSEAAKLEGGNVDETDKKKRDVEMLGSTASTVDFKRTDLNSSPFSFSEVVV